MLKVFCRQTDMMGQKLYAHGPSMRGHRKYLSRTDLVFTRRQNFSFLLFPQFSTLFYPRVVKIFDVCA